MAMASEEDLMSPETTSDRRIAKNPTCQAVGHSFHASQRHFLHGERFRPSLSPDFRWMTGHWCMIAEAAEFPSTRTYDSVPADSP